MAMRFTRAKAFVACAILIAAAILPPTSRASAQVVVVDCGHPYASVYVQESGGWCYASQQRVFYNVYLNWSFDPVSRLVYEHGSGIYYSPDTGWLYEPQQGLFFHPAAQWLYEPQSGLVLDLESGVFWNPQNGWLYEPVNGVFYSLRTGVAYQPSTGAIYQARAVADSGDQYVKANFFPRTGNALLDNILGQASTTVNANQAFIQRIPARSYLNVGSLLSPVGQATAIVNGAMRNANKALKGRISQAELARRYQLSNALNAGQAAHQAVRNSVYRNQLTGRYNAIAHQNYLRAILNYLG